LAYVLAKDFKCNLRADCKRLVSGLYKVA